MCYVKCVCLCAQVHVSPIVLKVRVSFPRGLGYQVLKLGNPGFIWMMKDMRMKRKIN